MYKKYQQLVSTKRGLASLIGIEVLVMYLIASLGIETGNLLYYIFFFVLLWDFLPRLVNLLKPHKTNVKKSGRKKTA